jgi:hypothetical protein
MDDGFGVVIRNFMIKEQTKIDFFEDVCAK